MIISGYIKESYRGYDLFIFTDDVVAIEQNAQHITYADSQKLAKDEIDHWVDGSSR